MLLLIILLDIKYLGGYADPVKDGVRIRLWRGEYY